MNVWSRAPAYVAAHDLVLRLGESLQRAESAGFACRIVGRCALRQSQRVLESVALALSFPARRAVALRRADEALCALRVTARVAHDLGALGSGALRRAAAEMDELGRMLGGWRRSTREANSKGTGPGLRARSARRELEQPGGELPLGVPQQERPRERER
jgi:hypothetical protein